MEELIKVGCNVLIKSRNGAKIAEVSRETKTQWVVKVSNPLNTDYYEEKYRKKNLRSVVGDVWSTSSMEFLTDERKDGIERHWAKEKRRKEVVFQISKMTPSLIPNEDIEAYEKLIYNYHKMTQ